jgi:hypothetical protein
LAKQQPDRWREVRDLLFAWDPLGVADFREQAEDEYDCVIGPLTGLLRRGATQEESVSFLNDMLLDHFGVSPTAGSLPALTRDLAAAIQGWYRKWG